MTDGSPQIPPLGRFGPSAPCKKESERMHPDISSVLLTHQQIAERTAQLGEAVSRDYQGKELTAICVLKGAALFQ